MDNQVPKLRADTAQPISYNILRGGFRLKKLVFLMLLASSPSSYSWEHDNSMGIGLKYGGIIGYQAAFSKEKHNLRGAVGMFGISTGYDYKLYNYFSVGLTTGNFGTVLASYQYHALNFTYHVSGKYTQGWNISLDTGVTRCVDGCDGIDVDYDNISTFGLGYTF